MITVTGLLGPSVTQPSLGGRAWHPPYHLDLSPSPWAVTGLLMAALVIGTTGVALGLRALARGWSPRVGRLLAAGIAAVAVLLLVPPMGSGDSLSYAAYGRIAAQGEDPYAVPPDRFRGGDDPVAGAAEPPWESTTSVYGPLTTATQALASTVGGTSVAATVFVLSLINAAAVVGTGLLLVRMRRGAPAAQARTALLWGLNPLVLWALVAGAHVDAVAAALGVGALAAVRRSPLAAGALVGVAISVKLPMLLYAAALLWPLRHRAGDAARVAAGAALVALPAMLLAGPDVLDQVRRASKFVSLATPWHLVEGLLDTALTPSVSRPLIGVLAAALAAGLVLVLARLAPPVPDPGREDLQAARAAFVLAGAWVLSAPYSLPWYDAVVWAPLALLPASRLDLVLLARGALLSCAYVPGRTVDMPEALRRLTVDRLRSVVTPWSLLAATALLVSWAVRRPRDRLRPRSRPAPER